jgi:hypothetical protein
MLFHTAPWSGPDERRVLDALFAAPRRQVETQTRSNGDYYYVARNQLTSSTNGHTGWKGATMPFSRRGSPDDANKGIPVDKQQNLSTEDYFELAQQQAASLAVGRLLDQHITQVMEIREQYEVDDLDLLSINIAKHRKIDQQVREKVVSLQTKMRAVIDKLASVIADRKYASITQDLEATRLSQNERKRSMELLEHDKAVIVSCQGMKAVVALCLDMNKKIIEALEDCEAKGDKQTARKMILANALLVHELLDFAIGYIEDFEVLGINDIHGLYERAMAENDRLLKLEARREKDASADNIRPEIREHILSDVKARREALNTLANEWAKYWNSQEERRCKAMSIGDIVPSLCALRDNAKGQIEVLQAVSVLGLVRTNVGAIESTVEALAGIELVALSTDRVKLLLGE